MKNKAAKTKANNIEKDIPILSYRYVGSEYGLE